MNDFQQLVDRNLSGLQWDERRKQRVLHALEPEGGTTMKRKLTITLALAAALVMITSVALAAAVLNYSPHANALTTARNAVMEKYGLTHTTMGLFTYDMLNAPDQTVIIFHSDVLDEVAGAAPGEYVVVIPEDGQAMASWSYDDIPQSLWKNANLSAFVWGQPQLEMYLQDRAEEAAANENRNVQYELIASTPGAINGVHVTPSPEDMVMIEVAQVTPTPDELSETAAIELAGTALMDTFSLTEGDLARVDFHQCELQQYGNFEPRIWHVWAYLKKDGYDWSMHVEIDASTGEILDIGMTTGGNG